MNEHDPRPGVPTQPGIVVFDVTPEIYLCTACGMAQIPMRLHTDECPGLGALWARAERAQRRQRLARLRARLAERADTQIGRPGARG